MRAGRSVSSRDGCKYKDTAVAQRLAGFGIRALTYNDPVRLPLETEEALRLSPTSFEEVMTTNDFVLPLTPLTPATRHLIGRREIAMMMRGSYLVNVCRGSVVDEQAVAEALADGHLAGYAADAFELEDWALDNRPHNRTCTPYRRLSHPVHSAYRIRSRRRPARDRYASSTEYTPGDER